MFIGADVRLWMEAKSIELAFNTMLTFCSFIRDRDRAADTPYFDNFHSTITIARDKFIREAVNLDPENCAGYSTETYNLSFMDSRSQERFKKCQVGLQDLGEALSKIGGGQPPSTRFFFGRSRTDDSEFEKLTRGYQKIDNELHDILSHLRSRRDVDEAMGTNRIAGRLNNNVSISNSHIRGLGDSLSRSYDLGKNSSSIDFIEIAKNAWFEKMIDGRLVYVNCFNEDRIVLDEPQNAYIKRLSSNYLSVDKSLGNLSMESRRQVGSNKLGGSTLQSLEASSSGSIFDTAAMPPRLPLLLVSKRTLQAIEKAERETLEKETEAELERRRQEAAWEDALNSAAEQKVIAGFTTDFATARKMVEEESVLWSQAYANGRYVVDIPRRLRVKGYD